MGDPPQAAQRRILLAEDDEANRNMLRVYLEKRGFLVEGVANGLEVLEALDQVGPFDIILLDIMMPVLSGLEALRRLRETDDTPVIMLTAVAGNTDVINALELGADDYVTKPYDFSVLVARIDARLRRRDKPDTPVEVSGPMSGSGEPGPGMIIDGRYEIVDKIGSGSFGVVYRARHRTLETDVAVKILRSVTGGGTELLSPIDSLGTPQGRVASQEAAEEFRREGVSACRVQHNNAVRVFDFGVLPQGLPYLVMELLHGRTVEEELWQKKRLPVDRAVSILLRVCECLAAAHAQHIVHRDVKPANVFLHRGPAGDEVVKVLDFGVAKLLNASDSITHEAIAGSPAYMAPERLRGKAYDGRADVYAVGIMLYELLTGDVPFHSDNQDIMAVALMQLREQPKPPSTVCKDLPSSIDAHVLQFLVKDPDKRPTAQQAIERLHDLLDVAGF